MYVPKLYKVCNQNSIKDASLITEKHTINIDDIDFFSLVENLEFMSLATRFPLKPSSKSEKYHNKENTILIVNKARVHIVE